MLYRISLLLGCGILAVLGYGYWQSRTHAYVHIIADDVSDAHRPQPIQKVTVILRDASNRQLAVFASQEPYRTIELTQPAEYSCRASERNAAMSAAARAEWQQCSERYSRWLSSWIQAAAHADVSAGSCQLRQIPISVTRYDEHGWLWWWVPLPHVGGKPHGYFVIDLAVDVERCAARK